jgi:hypothetical protein
MPTRIHETVNVRLVEEIQRQLRSIVDGGGPSAEFARDVEHGGSASITFPGPDYGKHDPDALFQHSKAQYPGVIIEGVLLAKEEGLVTFS